MWVVFEAYVLRGQPVNVGSIYGRYIRSRKLEWNISQAKNIYDKLGRKDLIGTPVQVSIVPLLRHALPQFILFQMRSLDLKPPKAGVARVGFRDRRLKILKSKERLESPADASGALLTGRTKVPPAAPARRRGRETKGDTRKPKEILIKRNCSLYALHCVDNNNPVRAGPHGAVAHARARPLCMHA
ncbi:hypothetical protein EVAR_18886_1 [Eumeta japonica]|uniref:Uncharacterized protein n=1 Tax=Eumeta variegata TaxID=151549 RepID=A0A4C1V3W2_EUMVA|nr:hypothetical protein EVAR_18886_1 [Eumeta japonica]